MKCCLAIKNELLINATWMNLKNIVLNETSQTQKKKKKPTKISLKCTSLKEESSIFLGLGWEWELAFR